MTTELLDPTRYHAQPFHEREARSLWPRVWLLAAHASELPSPGDLVTLEVGRASYLVVRGDDGVARAFHNACVHRGTRLCAERHASTRGPIRCPYHRWEYSLDGALARAPGIDPALLRGVGLEAARCDERAGFVWICADHGAPPLDEFLGEALPVLASFAPEHLVIEADRSFPLACNWKVSSDIHNEGYHLPSLHPDLLELIDLDAVAWRPLGLHAGFSIPLGVPSTGPWAGTIGPRLTQLATSAGVGAGDLTAPRLRDAMEAALRRAALRDGIPLASVERVADKHQLYIFPNVQLNFGAFELEIYRHRPHPDDPRRCTFDEQRLRRVPPGARPPRPQHRTLAPESLAPDSTLGQDVAMVARIQAGVGSPGLKQLRLGPLEQGIAHMHRGLSAYVGETA